jgi:hypothetical protein
VIKDGGTSSWTSKRRTFLLGILSCAVPACAPEVDRSSNVPTRVSTERPAAEPATGPPAATATEPAVSRKPSASASSSVSGDSVSRQTLIRRYSGERPVAWGEDVPGLVRRLPTTDRVVALTLDACGGRSGSGMTRH